MKSHTNIDGKSYKNIHIYHIKYVAIKDSKQIKINSVNPFCFIFSKGNRYFQEINRNKYLTLLPSNESKEKFNNI